MSRALRIALVAVAALVALAAIGVALYVAPRRDAPPITLGALRQKYRTVQSRFVEVAGVEVHYHDEGNGPVLLAFHGSFGALQTYDGVAAKLRDRYRILRFDQPPTGLSGPVPEGFAMTPEAFVRAFLEAVGVTRKVALIGNSSGGIFAYRYAATYPQDVAALVLVNTPPAAPVDNAAALARQPWTEQLSVKTCARFAKRRSMACWRDFLESMYVRKERVGDALVQQYYDYNRQPGAGWLTSIAAIMRVDAEVVGYLSRITAPTLVLWGTDSPVLPPDTARLLASRLTATQPEVRILERVAHYPPLEAPDEVAAAAGEFLDRTLPRDPATTTAAHQAGTARK
jgi:pimeloyl-ACP methyl ester carboxylesterase